jgi:phage repressor protein C with HTH and peptisase S24 domain
MNFQEALKNYMKRNSIKGKDLAVKCGISPQYITDIRSGRRTPTFQVLNSILEELKLLEDEKYEVLELWKEAKDNSYSRSNARNIVGDIIELPVVGTASAGPGKLNFENPEKHIPVITYEGMNYSKCFIMKVEGDSMEPRIRDGSEIIVDTTKINLEENLNKIVVSNLNDEAYVKVLKLNKNKLVLESINDKYSRIVIKSTDDFNIVGRVIEIRYREVLK